MTVDDQHGVSGSDLESEDDPAAAPAVDLPGGDQVAADPDETDGPGADAQVRNRIEEFVRSLPEGYCICPTCLAVGAVVEDPPFDPHVTTCPECYGHGKTRTGSLVNMEAERECERCQKRGWVARDVDSPPASPARSSDFLNDAPPVDAFGRTPDSPEFDWASVRRDVERDAEPAGV